jgi:4-amino-4-deoxy-L-arabinose transferase-like glycosyltransferase
MLFGCFFLLTLYFGARALLLRRGNSNEILLAYVFVALATLTKGLIGIVLPALVFTSLMVARRDCKMIKAAKLHWGIPLFLLIAGPWFYLVNQATEGIWLSDFIFIHHIDRYTAGEGHEQPFFYYFATLPADFLPWTALALPALVKRRDYRRVWSEPDTQFFVLWFVSVFVFFTLSNTKRDLYLIPVLPTLALMVANYIDRWASGESSPGPLEFLPAVFFAIVALCGILVPIAAWIWRPGMLVAVLPASVVLAAGGGASTIYVMRRRLAAVFAVSAMMLLLTLASVYWLLPYIEQFKSHRAFSAQVRRMVSPSAPLYVFQDRMNDFNFYMERAEIPVLAAEADIMRLRDGGEASYLLIKERDLRRLKDSPRRWIIASAAIGSTTWHLLEINSERAN